MSNESAFHNVSCLRNVVSDFLKLHCSNNSAAAPPLFYAPASREQALPEQILCLEISNGGKLEVGVHVNVPRDGAIAAKSSESYLYDCAGLNRACVREVRRLDIVARGMTTEIRFFINIFLLKPNHLPYNRQFNIFPVPEYCLGEIPLQLPKRLNHSLAFDKFDRCVFVPDNEIHVVIYQMELTLVPVIRTSPLLNILDVR
jgi:hypothetical protein